MLHFRTIGRTWHELLTTPFSTIANSLMIGIALALPIAGYSFVKSLESLNFSLEHKPHINIYISPSASQADISAIQGELEFTEGIKSKKIITQDQALSEFEKASGITNVLDSLSSNPLPTTIIITPEDPFLNDSGIQKLTDQLAKIDGIDEIQVNQEWLERLSAITHFARTLLLVLTILIAFAILLTLSNTIRLLISNRKDEIIVSKLVGANDAYVRLPFLYFGFFYGLLGGIAAIGIHSVVVVALQQPIDEFSHSYNHGFQLYVIPLIEIVYILSISAFLGWIASRISVWRHLQAIKPQ